MSLEGSSTVVYSGQPEYKQVVLEQIKPETSLEEKMTKSKLFYFGHIIRGRVL